MTVRTVASDQQQTRTALVGCEIDEIPTD